MTSALCCDEQQQHSKLLACVHVCGFFLFIFCVLTYIIIDVCMSMGHILDANKFYFILCYMPRVYVHLSI